jgi:hypothetical protein
MTELEEAQRETIEALRAQVADLKEWLAECRAEKAKMYTEGEVRSAVTKALTEALRG